MAMKFWFGKKESEPEATGTVTCDVVTFADKEPAVMATQAASLFVTAQGSVTGSKVTGGTISQPARQTGVAAPEVKPPAPAGGEPEALRSLVGAAPRRAAATPVEMPKSPAMPVSAGKGAVVSIQAPVNRLQVGVSGLGVIPSGDSSKMSTRPVMTPVRMASAAAPVRLAPVSAEPAAPVPAAPVASMMVAGALANVAAAARGVPAFGLRPKEGAGGAASAPGASAPAVLAAPKAPAPGSLSAPAPSSAPVLSDAEKGVVERDAAEAVRPKTDQRALYYQLMNGLYDAVLILDDQGHIVDCNTRVSAMLGYSREDTWDVPIEKVITGMSSQMFEHLKRNLAENHHILMDARCFRQDGTSFAGEVGVSTLSLTRGSNIVFAIRNVERRKKAMDEMRKGHAALEIALAPSFVCDLDGFFLIVNQALLDAFGIPDETQAKSVRFIDLLPDAARFFLRASCGEKLRETLRVPTPNGVPLKIELALKPVQSGQTVTAVAGSILQV